MKIRNKFIILTIIILGLISIVHGLLYNLNFTDFIGNENLFRTFFITILIFISAATISVLATSIIKGELVKKTFQTLFLWTSIIFLAVFLFNDFSNYFKQTNNYKTENINHNNYYKSFYGDKRDEFVKQVIQRIEIKQKEIGDYKIFRIRVIERDTLLDNKTLKYYDIHQIYFIGEYKDDFYKYVSRHIILDDNKIVELYDKPFLKDETGKKELEECEFLEKKMFNEHSLDSTKYMFNEYGIDLIKLKE
jgi:hypothetical protein